MRILLIAPEFYRYWDATRWGLQQLGHEVEVSVYDRRATLRDSYTYARDVHIPRRLRGQNPNPELQRRAHAILRGPLDAKNYDAVIVTNGAVVGSEIFEPLRGRGVPVVLWLQDELSRLIFHTVESMRVFTAVGTYSADDVALMQSHGLDAALVPNGFDPRLKVEGTPRQRDVVFIGARDAHRTAILQALTDQGLPVMAYGNQWSHRIRDRVRGLSWDRPDIRSRPNVSRAEASQILFDALCAVNIHVPGIQDGINPRTFEICGVGGLQATDRADISGYYDPGTEILLYSSVDELGELIRRAASDRAWAAQIREAARQRTLDEHTIVHRCRQLVDMM